MSVGSAKSRLPLAEAEGLVRELAGELASFCERLEVAGSIRRRRPTIGDLELVCVPRVATQLDLFGGAAAEINLLDQELSRIVGIGELDYRFDKHGHPRFGERYKALLWRGVGVDLFSVLQPAQWGVIFTIRTGSAEFSHRLVTPVERGGWMPRGMYCRDGSLWRDGERVETPEETEVFAALGRSWIEPERREVG